MIPVRSLLLNRLLRSSWAVAVLSLGLASLLEWWLIVDHHADLG
jgi:hypothetical protein